MNGFFAVYRKEMREYFATPIAFAVVAVFWALCGYLFSFNLFFVSAAQMVTSFHNMTILMLLIVPLLTMRSFAEEHKSGTTELLLTLPLHDAATVLGKYAAGLTLLGLMVAGTATAIVPLVLHGQPDFGPIIGGYLGVLLSGAAYLAIGMAVSSACSNQIVAASLTWAILVLLWFIDYPASLNVLPGLSPLFLHLSLSTHNVDLIRGVLPAQSVVYLLSLAVVAITAAVQMLRWRRLR